MAIGANKAMRPKMIPRTPRIMAKIQIFFAKLGNSVVVFGVGGHEQDPFLACSIAWQDTLLATRGPPTVTRQNLAAKFGSRSVATLRRLLRERDGCLVASRGRRWIAGICDRK